MRRKINNELKQYLLEFAKDKTIDELLPLVNKKFNETYNRYHLQKYMIRNEIPYKYTNPIRSNNMSKLPIGTERVRNDGMVMVKVGRNKWMYKQRYIYEQHHKVKLTQKDFIIFLDGDRTNFNIDNLKKLSAQQSGTYADFKRNYGISFDDAAYNEFELAVVDLMIKTKQLQKTQENA